MMGGPSSVVDDCRFGFEDKPISAHVELHLWTAIVICAEVDCVSTKYEVSSLKINVKVTT